ncbi:N-acetyltransferase family protein [Candidatus Harpocratesius sp.]
MKNIQIIALSLADFTANLDFMNAEIQRSFWLARTTPISHEEMKSFFKFISDTPEAIFLVAKYHSQIIGNIYVIPRNEELLHHIGLLSYQVHPDFQKKGVGSFLMKKIIEKSKNTDLEILIAEVLQSNYTSIALLKKFSFLQQGVIPDGVKINNSTYFDLLIFTRRILH